MNITVKLPKLGETTDMVIVDAWVVDVGDVVAVDEPLLTVETDKATLEVPSPVSGTVIELLVAVGDEVRTGERICKLAAS